MENKVENQQSEVKNKVNVMALLSYLGFLVIIPLVVEKKDEFVRFHIKQGLVLLIAEVATMMIGWVPIIGWLVWMVGSLAWLVLLIIGITNVVKNKKEPIPVVGQFAEKLKV